MQAHAATRLGHHDYRTRVRLFQAHAVTGLGHHDYLTAVRLFQAHVAGGLDHHDYRTRMHLFQAVTLVSNLQGNQIRRTTCWIEGSDL